MRLPTASFRYLFLLDMNPIVRFLVLSDVIILGSAQMFNPLFAIFVVERIQNGNTAVVGTAVAIFFITKSIGQLFAASLIDQIKGEFDDFWLMIVGSLVLSVFPIAYLFIETPIMLYLVNFILGLGTAIAYPSYMAIFTRHIDKGMEGREWGVKFTLTDVVGAVAASVGGFIALSYGFEALITIYVIISLAGALTLIPVRLSLKTLRTRGK